MPRKSSSRTISSRPAATTGAATGNIQRAVVEFNPDYTNVRRDLKRIGILAGIFFALMIVLAFVMPLVIR